MNQIPTLEIDSVELNAKRETFNNNMLIDFYAEGFVDLGFICLFAAAFPLGPLV